MLHSRPAILRFQRAATVPDFCHQAPGGIGEMFLDGQAGKEMVLLKGHKGFVRKAMAHGVPLVPVYGEEEGTGWQERNQ